MQPDIVHSISFAVEMYIYFHAILYQQYPTISYNLKNIYFLNLPNFTLLCTHSVGVFSQTSEVWIISRSSHLPQSMLADYVRRKIWIET